MSVRNETGREPLTEFQLERVFAQVGEQYQDRIEELELHTVDELADYVWSQALEIPQGETLTRKEIYGWDSKSVDVYKRWGKKELIVRIITMEEHDLKRSKGVEIPSKKGSAPEPTKPQPSVYRAVGEVNLRDME